MRYEQDKSRNTRTNAYFDGTSIEDEVKMQYITQASA